jgi:hypothetical protein
MRNGILLMAGLGLAAGPAHAQGKPDFEFHRELAQGKRFYVSTIIGDVVVVGTSGRTVEATAVKKAGRHGDPEDVTIEVVELDDGVALCVRYPHQHGGRYNSDDREDKNPCSSHEWNGGHERNDTEVNLTLRVPVGLRLHAGTVSGDVRAERLAGDLEIHSVSGDVQLTGGSGPAIDLETVSGDVTLEDVTSKDVSGHTVSGTVVFQGPIMDAGTYDFATTSGDIQLLLPQQPNATLSGATFSGRFSSDLPTSRDDSRHRRHRVAATWGNGSARLDLESLSGDITIRVTKG